MLELLRKLRMAPPELIAVLVLPLIVRNLESPTMFPRPCSLGDTLGVLSWASLCRQMRQGMLFLSMHALGRSNLRNISHLSFWNEPFRGYFETTADELYVSKCTAFAQYERV